MRITEILDRSKTTFSFEFFPPKNEAGAQALYEAIADLAPLKPSFVSVTYGAGGGTRELTHDLVERIATTTDITPIPHLTCVCHQEEEIAAVLRRYAGIGVRNVLALGGDPPRDRPDHDRASDAFRYAAGLVGFVRKLETELGGEPFGIGVAGFPEGHPATPNRLDEMDHLKAKIDAGADYICTQLFFDNRDFYDFRERCELAGIHVPIVAGIMPITTRKGMRRMADLSAGSRFPAALLRALKRAGDDEAAVARVGVHWATEQCRDLLDHRVAGVHLYTLNKSNATKQIYQSLGVEDSTALANRPV
ncbi:MAG: methylenetetrahydrofolate reductase [NAD(P)H] [Planctomycetota bacterium]